MEEEAAVIVGNAADAVIVMQQRNGLDEDADGQWRRKNFGKVFAKCVGESSTTYTTRIAGRNSG